MNILKRIFVINKRYKRRNNFLMKDHNNTFKYE